MLRKIILLSIISLIFVIHTTVVYAGNTINDSNHPLVETTQIKQYSFYEEHKALGQCELENSKEYYVELSGTVDCINYKSGQQVKKGDVIVAIDAKLAQSSLAKAKSAFKQSQDQHNNNIQLYEKNFIGKNDLDNSQAELDKKLDALNYAQVNYHRRMITAICDGKIGVINLKVGQLVHEKLFLFSLISENDNKYVKAELPENLHNQVSHNSQIYILDKHNNKIYGNITSISPYLNDNGMISIKIMLPASCNVLHKSYVPITILYQHIKAMGIPEMALQINDKGHFVYKVIGNKVKRVYVTLKCRYNGMAAIESNHLALGDQVVIKGIKKITDQSFIQLPKKDSIENKKIENKKVLFIVGSIEKKSCNHIVAEQLHEFSKLHNIQSSILDLQKYPLEIYNKQVETSNGIPKNASLLKEIIDKYDAIFFITPGYNASIPPLLKNTIDWLSKIEKAFDNKSAAIASVSYTADATAIYHLRDILSSLNINVISDHVHIDRKNFHTEIKEKFEELKGVLIELLNS